LLIIIAPNGHILANIAIVSQLSLAIDLSSKGLPGQLPIFLKNPRRPAAHLWPEKPAATDVS